MPVVPAEGTILSVEGATPGTYEEIAQIISIGAVNKTVAAVKTTFITSSFQTYRPGRIPDNGQVTFGIVYDPNLAGHQRFTTALDAAEILNFKIEYADGLTTPASVKFAGFLTQFEEGEKADENNVEATVTIQVTGPAVRTPGTP